MSNRATLQHNKYKKVIRNQQTRTTKKRNKKQLKTEHCTKATFTDDKFAKTKQMFYFYKMNYYRALAGAIHYTRYNYEKIEKYKHWEFH